MIFPIVSLIYAQFNSEGEQYEAAHCTYKLEDPLFEGFLVSNVASVHHLRLSEECRGEQKGVSCKRYISSIDWFEVKSKSLRVFNADKFNLSSIRVEAKEEVGDSLQHRVVIG